jgi:DNA mismatch repair protein MutS2
LEETQRELTQRSEAAAREQSEVEKLRAQYEARIQKLQDEMQREIARSRRDAADVVAQTRREAEDILRALRRAARTGGGGENKDTEAARGRLRELEARTGSTRGNGAIAQIEASVAGTATAKQNAPQSTVDFDRTSRPLPKIGGAVRVKNLDKEGILLTEPDARGRCEVRIGAMKLRVARENLEGLVAEKPGGIAGIQVRKSVTVPEEINFIGQTTAEAIPALEKYLDDAILADMRSVRVVHGKGTGALRGAIHRALKAHHGVSGFALAAPNEGGEGATIVELGLAPNAKNIKGKESGRFRPDSLPFIFRVIHGAW